MSKKYLDTVGLNKLVANILSKFASKNHSHSNATTNSAGFMSSSDKVKLDGVAAGANKTIVDSSLNGTSTNAIQNKAVKTALDGKASSSHTHPTAQITGLDSALAGKASASHKHDAGDITSGILPIGRGGTGAGTADAALKNLMDNCTVGGTAAPSDDLWYFTANLDAAQPPVKRKHSALWSYIKSKTDPLYQPRGSYAAASHTHSISNITNLQSQLDSKQPKGSYAASSHTHTISNVTNLQTELDKKQVKIQPVTTAGTGSAYTANVPHIKALTAGMKFTMVPHVVSAAASPTLNVNNLGAKAIRQRLSNSTQSTVTGVEANWLAAGKPVDVMYDGQFWVVDFVRPNMASAYGMLPVSKVSGLDDALSGKLSLKDIEASVGLVDAYTPGNSSSKMGELYAWNTGFVAVKNAFALLFIKEMSVRVRGTPFDGYFGTIEIPGEYKKLAFHSLGGDKIIKFSNPTISGEGTSWAETHIHVKTEKSLSLNDSFVYNDVLIALAK